MSLKHILDEFKVFCSGYSKCYPINIHICYVKISIPRITKNWKIMRTRFINDTMKLYEDEKIGFLREIKSIRTSKDFSFFFP